MPSNRPAQRISGKPALFLQWLRQTMAAKVKQANPKSM